jgi:SAM-dependent methyltransferase
MNPMNRIVEFKKKYKNTLIGKIGKIFLNNIRMVRFYCRLIYYRYFPSRYYSQKKYSGNNSVSQRQVWGATFHTHSNVEYELKSSFIWGDWDEQFQLQIKYNVLLKKILSYSHPHATVLELGAYDGMWTQYFLSAGKIICVDLFESGFEKIKERCKTEKIQFYCTEGNELRGIMDQSVDLVFSVDSSIRASKDDITCYFNEFLRVLKQDGVVVLHLPCLESPMSMGSCFTYLTLKDIKRLCIAVFSKYEIHFNILPHGVIVEGFK